MLVPAPALAEDDFQIIQLDDPVATDGVSSGDDISSSDSLYPGDDVSSSEGELPVVKLGDDSFEVVSPEPAYEEGEMPLAEPVETLQANDAYVEPAYEERVEQSAALVAQSQAISAASSNAASWKRLADDTRYGTMAAIVSEGFSKSDWAVVASGSTYPDALVAAALAGTKKCPVILTSTDVLSSEALARLRSLRVQHAYIMGGTSAVSAAVEQAIENEGIDTHRLEGATRYGTSVASLRQTRSAGSSSKTVVVTSGTGFADALSIGPWTYVSRSPIVLAGADGTLTDEVVEAIKDDGKVSRVVLVGGTSVVSNTIKKQLGSSYSYVRLAGKDRYATNKSVMDWTTRNGLGWSKPAVASGSNFPDALVGSAFCGANKSPIVLNHDSTIAMLMGHRSQFKAAYVLGGMQAVRDFSSLTNSSELDGVDISGWNEGVNTTTLEADFVIIKATEGMEGTVYHPQYARRANNALNAGKLVGFYHYANGGDPVKEADEFFDAIKDYKGRAIACLDWEGQGNKVFNTGFDVGWCRQFLDELEAKFGGTPFIYTSKNYTNVFDWSPVASRFPLWGAEYAYSDRDTLGYEANPWQSSSGWGAWGPLPTIFQYSSLGVLDYDLSYPGYKPLLSAASENATNAKTSNKDDELSMIDPNADHFDFNKFYGTPALWHAFEG